MSVGTPKVTEIDCEGDKTNRDWTVSLFVPASANYLADTATDIRAALALAGYVEGAALSLDPYAHCGGVNVKLGMPDRINGVYYWRCKAKFSTKKDDDPQNDNKQDPKTRAWKINLRQEHFTSGVTKDSSGVAVTNKAGDPVRREKNRARLVVSVDGFCDTIDPALCQEYPDGLVWTRNAAIWYPWGPRATQFNSFQIPIGAGLLRALTADTNFENNTVSIDFHAEVLVDQTGFHKDKFWNEGLRGWQTLAEKTAGRPAGLLMDPATRAFVSQPVPLDNNGVILAPGGTMIELTPQYYPNVSWTAAPFWHGYP